MGKNVILPISETHIHRVVGKTRKTEIVKGEVLLSSLDDSAKEIYFFANVGEEDVVVKAMTNIGGSVFKMTYVMKVPKFSYIGKKLSQGFNLDEYDTDVLCKKYGQSRAV